VQQCRRARTVDVIVAKHGDLLAVLQRRLHPLDGLLHVLESQRFGEKRFQGRIEIVGGSRGSDAPRQQQPRQRERYATPKSEGPRRIFIAFDKTPAPARKRPQNA
jgi:hypothetical protein